MKLVARPSRPGEEKLGFGSLLIYGKGKLKCDGYTKRLLIDIEGKNGAIAYFSIPENGEKVEVLLAGKEIIPVPKIERAYKIYKLLKKPVI